MTMKAVNAEERGRLLTAAEVGDFVLFAQLTRPAVLGCHSITTAHSQQTALLKSLLKRATRPARGRCNWTAGLASFISAKTPRSKRKTVMIAAEVDICQLVMSTDLYGGACVLSLFFGLLVYIGTRRVLASISPPRLHESLSVQSVPELILSPIVCRSTPCLICQCCA